MRGFLNRYSTTAIEEDKAEIFAGLIRHPVQYYLSRRPWPMSLVLRTLTDNFDLCIQGAIIESDDTVLRSKGLEMIRRLALFCPSMNEEWW